MSFNGCICFECINDLAKVNTVLYTPSCGLGGNQYLDLNSTNNNTFIGCYYYYFIFYTLLFSIALT